MRFRDILMASATQGGGVGTVPSNPQTPLYSDNFNSYADGFRLVAGDPNANAGQVATNPGNLGWTAITTVAASNARYNPIIYQGKIVRRTANAVSDFTEPGTYLLAVPSVTIPPDHYVKIVGPPATTSDTGYFSTAASDEKNRVSFGNSLQTTFNVFRYNSGTKTTVATVAGFSTARRMGGINGAFSLLNLASETLALIINNNIAYLRRGPGFPIGTVAGYAFTNPGGSSIGLGTLGPFYNSLDSVEAGAASTVLFITETYNSWYPRVLQNGGYAGGAASITFTGTYLGTAPAYLEWALFDPITGAQVKAWANVTAPTIGGGNWSAPIVVPWGLNATKAYAIGFRPKDASFNYNPGAAICGVKEFYVTFNIGLIGQSNSVYITRLASSGNYPDYPGGSAYTKSDPPSLVQGVYVPSTLYYSSTVDSGASDKICAGLCDVLQTQLGGPVSLEVLAIPATGASALNPSSGVNANYIQTHHAFAGNAYELLYLSQGENEFVSAGSSWRSNWETNIPLYRAMSGQPVGTVIPVFLALTGRVTGANSQSDTSAQATRVGQAQILSTVSDIYLCHTYIGCKMLDDFHYTPIVGEGQDEANRRIGLTVKKYLSGSGLDGVGPSFGTPTRAAAVITIPITANGATSYSVLSGADQAVAGSALALTSWQVSDDGFATTKTITSVTFTGGNVVITLAADPGHIVSIRNHYGYAPDITSWVFGNYADGGIIGARMIAVPVDTTT